MIEFLALHDFGREGGDRAGCRSAKEECVWSARWRHCSSSRGPRPSRTSTRPALTSFTASVATSSCARSVPGTLCRGSSGPTPAKSSASLSIPTADRWPRVTGPARSGVWSTAGSPGPAARSRGRTGVMAVGYSPAAAGSVPSPTSRASSCGSGSTGADLGRRAAARDGPCVARVRRLRSGRALAGHRRPPLRYGPSRELPAVPEETCGLGVQRRRSRSTVRRSCPPPATDLHAWPMSPNQPRRWASPAEHVFADAPAVGRSEAAPRVALSRGPWSRVPGIARGRGTRELRGFSEQADRRARRVLSGRTPSRRGVRRERGRREGRPSLGPRDGRSIRPGAVPGGRRRRGGRHLGAHVRRRQPAARLQSQLGPPAPGPA